MTRGGWLTLACFVLGAAVSQWETSRGASTGVPFSERYHPDEPCRPTLVEWARGEDGSGRKLTAREHHPTFWDFLTWDTCPR